jgi:hypothetical protein
MKHRKSLFFIIISFLTFSSCKKGELVQNDSHLIVYSFSTNKCVTTPDNGFLLSGNSSISKIDADGNLLWTIANNAGYVLPLRNNEFVSCTDNNTYISFSRLSASGIASSGTQKLFMSDSSELSNPKIAELSSGDFMCAGVSLAKGAAGADSTLLIIKTDKNGNPFWNKKIKLGANLSVINKVIEVNTNGNVIVTGNTGKIIYSNKIYYAMIDSSGTLLWEYSKAFGQWENYPTDIHVLNSNEYIVTGYFDVSKTVDYNYQFYAYKINNAGDSTNLYVTGGSKQDYCISSVLVANTGNLILVGMEGRGNTFTDLNLSSIKIFTINTSLTSVISDKTYAQLLGCSALSALYNSDGSLSVIGIKYAYDNPNIQQTFFLKIKPDGSF